MISVNAVFLCLAHHERAKEVMVTRQIDASRGSETIR